MTKALHRFRGEFIAFWYGYKHAFYLLVPAFLIADFILPANPGDSVRIAGTCIIGFIGFAIVYWDDPHSEWSTEMPKWACPVMLGILFASWVILGIRHGLLARFFSSAFENFKFFL